jgi:hypothetical protein
MQVEPCQCAVCQAEMPKERIHYGGVFLAILAEHFSEEQPREMILNDASLKENAALRIWRGSLAHPVDMRSA